MVLYAPLADADRNLGIIGGIKCLKPRQALAMSLAKILFLLFSLETGAPDHFRFQRRLRPFRWRGYRRGRLERAGGRYGRGRGRPEHRWFRRTIDHPVANPAFELVGEIARRRSRR